jgi:hypothetical protein
MTGESYFDLVEFHLVWLPWYAPRCVPAWLGGWWLAARPLVRRHRRRVAEFEAALPATALEEARPVTAARLRRDG